MKVVEFLKCPKDDIPYSFNGQSVTCEKCGDSFSVQDNIVNLLENSKLAKSDVKQKSFYEEIYNVEKQTGKDTFSETLVNRMWRKTRNVYLDRKKTKNHTDCFLSQFDFNIASDQKLNILEIGCGTGTPGTEICLKNKDKTTYVGIDMALYPLEILMNKFREEKATDFYLLNMDMHSAVLRDQSFDVIFGRGIIHHFPSKDKILLANKICALLRPAGVAFFLEPLNTNPILRGMRLLTKPFRPNLEWEHPFSESDINGFVKPFDVSKIYYFEGITLLSVFFLFNKKLFEICSDLLNKIEKKCSSLSFYKRLFTKAVFVLNMK